MSALLAPLRLAVDAALPPRCPGCGAITGADHRFCLACWQALRFLGPPACAGCGVPFAFDKGEGARCAGCLTAPPPFDGVHAAVAYGPVARTVALRLKYGRRLGHGETIARALARLVPPGVDLLVPVPLHRWRLWSRGYNQSALIARALAGLSGVRADVALLQRRRATPVLRGLGPRARARAVSGAFAVRDGVSVAGLHLALVDDVFTSGATADACARALKNAGAARVSVLCWARVLDDNDEEFGAD